MSTLVVDASVAVKWYLPADDSEAALRLLSDEAALHAPDLLRTEVANAFWKHILRGDIDRSVWSFARLRLERSIRQWHESRFYLEEAFSMACEMSHPVYDCIYMAIARQLGGKLVTADQRLVTRMRGTEQSALLLPLAEFAAGD